eukprot:9483010-Pyramimonas_sp.AAC.1
MRASAVAVFTHSWACPEAGAPRCSPRVRASGGAYMHAACARRLCAAHSRCGAQLVEDDQWRGG